MVLMVNNSERVITLIDTMLTPGQPTEVEDDYLNHPGVQRIMKDVTERNVPVLVIVEDQTEKDNA